MVEVFDISVDDFMLRKLAAVGPEDEDRRRYRRYAFGSARRGKDQCFAVWRQAGGDRLESEVGQLARPTGHGRAVAVERIDLPRNGRHDDLETGLILAEV